MKYLIQDREAGNVIDEFNNIDDAMYAMSAYEMQDKADGTYTQNFYEIVEIK